MKGKTQVYYEIDKCLMNDTKPSFYLKNMLKKSIFTEYPFSMLSSLVKIQQSPSHHPEGNVWNHTMLVIDKAAERKYKSKDPRILMWAALLHDIGKTPATKIRKGKITAYDHDRIGGELTRKFLRVFTKDEVFISKTAAMVRWHMQILYVTKGLPFANIKDMLKQVPLEEIVLLSLCDRLGRGEMEEGMIREEEKNVKLFAEICKSFLSRN